MATRTPRVEPDETNWGAVPASNGAGPFLPPSTSADDSQIEQSPIERVMEALQVTVEPGKRVRMQLYRLVSDAPGKLPREDYCCDMTPEDFETGGLSGIRDAWGPGAYVAHLMGYKRGSTYFTRVASPRFSIAPLPGSQQRAGDSPAMAGIEAAMRAMAESQSRLIDTLVEIRATPAPNPREQLQETLALMTSMREAMGMNQPQRAEKSSIGEIVEAIKELKEVSSIVNPGGAPEKSTMEQLIELAGPLVQMVQQSIQSAPQRAQPVQQEQVPMLRPPAEFQLAPAPPQSQPPQPAIASPEKSEPMPEQNLIEPDEAAVLAELQSHLSSLVSMAEKNETVENGALLVYDKLPDDWIELLHMPIWWEALKRVAPQVELHEKWIRAVRDEVVQMFVEDESEVEKLDGTVAGA